jgi:hypothetical protein
MLQKLLQHACKNVSLKLRENGIHIRHEKGADPNLITRPRAVAPLSYTKQKYNPQF